MWSDVNSNSRYISVFFGRTMEQNAWTFGICTQNPTTHNFSMRLTLNAHRFVDVVVRNNLSTKFDSSTCETCWFGWLRKQLRWDSVVGVAATKSNFDKCVKLKGISRNCCVYCYAKELNFFALRKKTFKESSRGAKSMCDIVRIPECARIESW